MYFLSIYDYVLFHRLCVVGPVFVESRGVVEVVWVLCVVRL